MTAYSDAYINISKSVGDIDIEPFDRANVQPNSYELTLDKHLYIMSVNKDGKMEAVPATCPYTFKNGEFVIASSRERIKLVRKTCAMVMGKSTLGRLGISCHQTAGLIDCGFDGTITLELSNVGGNFVLEEGMKIAQVLFMGCHPVSFPYGSDGLGSHYQGQEGPTIPKGVAIKKIGKTAKTML